MSAHKFIKKWGVDKVKDDFTGEDHTISVDPKDGTFWILYQGEEITADDLDECQRKLRAAIKQHHTLVWEPIILLDVTISNWNGHYGSSHRMHSAEHGEAIVAINKLTRVERAPIQRHDGTNNYRYRAWATERHAHDAEEGEKSGVHLVRYDDIQLLYTEELWSRLQMIKESVCEANRRMRSLLGDQDEKTRKYDAEAITTRVMALGVAQLEAPPLRRIAPPPPTKKH